MTYPVWREYCLQITYFVVQYEQTKNYRSENSHMMNSLINFCQSLEVELSKSSDLMSYLKPKFSIVGSIAEGTRLGLANELDLTMSFEGWPDGTFCVRDNPYFLRKTEKTPQWMDPYFDSSGCFLFNNFKYDLLKAIEQASSKIKLPPNLKVVTKNKDFQKGLTKCKDGCSKRLSMSAKEMFKQCKHCAVFISQTKVGACIQLEYNFNALGTVYCSVDLIPMFKIKEMAAMELSRIGNKAMLAPDHPWGWFKYLMGVVRHDRVTQELADEININTIKTVSLKTMNCNAGRNYYVRPGQVLGPEKFFEEEAKESYIVIKLITKLLEADLNMYWVKKELRTFARYHTAGNIFSVLSKGKFKTLLEDKIDFEKWNKSKSSYKIPLKRV